MRKIQIQITKFTLVGAANFVLTFMVFFVLLKIFSVNYMISLAITWIVGMFFSYVLNFLWVFKLEKKIQFQDRFFKFVLGGLASISLNMMLLNYIVERTHSDPFYVQILLMPFVIIFNFTMAKLWSLRSL